MFHAIEKEFVQTLKRNIKQDKILKTHQCCGVETKKGSKTNFLFAGFLLPQQEYVHINTRANQADRGVKGVNLKTLMTVKLGQL